MHTATVMRPYLIVKEGTLKSYIAFQDYNKQEIITNKCNRIIDGNNQPFMGSYSCNMNVVAFDHLLDL